MDYMYPTLEEMIQYPSTAKGPGASTYINPEMGLVYKDTRRIRNPASEALYSAMDHLHIGIPQLGFRMYERKKDIGSVEAGVLSMWNSAGIPSARVLEVQEGVLVLEYIPGIPVYFILNTDEPRYDEFHSLADTVQNIRRVAKEHDDPGLLHPDSHLANFLYHNRQSYAIDSGDLVRENIPFSEADALINLYFIFGIYALRSVHRESYMRHYLSGLTGDEKRTMLALNRDINPALRAMMQAYTALHVLRTGKKPDAPYRWFTDENIREVNRIISGSMEG